MTKNELVIVEVTKETRSQIKKLATLEEKTIPQYLDSIISKAYEQVRYNPSQTSSRK